MKTNTFLIADNHPLFRMGLKNIISAEYNDVLKIFEASNGKQALEILDKNIVDYLLMDINLPVMNGLILIARLRKMKMSIKIIVLSCYSDPSLVYHLLKMGVHGYLSKNHNIEKIRLTIQAVINGELSYPVEYDEKIKHLIQSGNIRAINISEKEKQILDLVAQGMTGVEIAEVTGYTKRTVETKKVRLEKRFGVKNSAALIHLAHRVGLLI